MQLYALENLRSILGTVIPTGTDILIFAKVKGLRSVQAGLAVCKAVFVSPFTTHEEVSGRSISLSKASLSLPSGQLLDVTIEEWSSC